MFNFQTQNDTWNEPPVIWNTFTQVKAWLKKYTVDSKDYVIMSEYDEIISFDDFVAMVEAKQKDEHNLKNKDNFTHARNVDGYRFSDGEFC